MFDKYCFILAGMHDLWFINSKLFLICVIFLPAWLFLSKPKNLVFAARPPLFDFFDYLLRANYTLLNQNWAVGAILLCFVCESHLLTHNPHHHLHGDSSCPCWHSTPRSTTPSRCSRTCTATWVKFNRNLEFRAGFRDKFKVKFSTGDLWRS